MSATEKDTRSTTSSSSTTPNKSSEILKKLLYVTAGLTGLMGIYVHFFSKKKVPCQFPLVVTQGGGSIEEDFQVTEYRNYIFALRFEYKDRKDKDRVRELVGDGAYKVYTRESADTNQPVLVITKTKEEVQKYHEGLKSGKYVTRPTDFSGVFPIHICVLKKDQEEPFINETLKTLGYFAQGFNPSGVGGYFERMITVLALKPGSYKIKATPMLESELFSIVTTKLAITFHPNAAPLEEKNALQDKEPKYANSVH